jgi:predicted chitinase
MANVTFGEPRFKKPEAVVKEIEKKEPYKCTHCDEEITLEQIKYVMTGKIDGKITDEANVKKVIEFLNKYRTDYKLDTCLRKAHFIAQVGAESKFKSTYEGSVYQSTGLTIFNSEKTVRFRANQEIDETVLESLKNNLNSIFKLVDEDDKIITKTNDELKNLLKTQKVIIDEKELYGKYIGEKDPKNSKLKVDKLIKEVLKSDKKVDYRIYLKIHPAFGIPTLSRAYANRGENGDELSRDGWKFRGKGIKQVTFKNNYSNFTKFRKTNPFPDDTNGDIDFTATTDAAKLKGNFDKLADDTIFGVQSAIWYWIEGNGSVYKNGDLDDVKKVTVAINGGYNGLENRDEYVKHARQDDGLKVFKHYKLEHENGTKEVKETIIARLKFLLETRNQKDSATKKMVNLKDSNAQVLLDELDVKEVKKEVVKKN